MSATAHSAVLRGSILIFTTIAARPLAPAAMPAVPPIALNAATPAAPAAALPLIGSDIWAPQKKEARSRRA